jgi:hypothetical protein
MKHRISELESELAETRTKKKLLEEMNEASSKEHICRR